MLGCEAALGIGKDLINCALTFITNNFSKKKDKK